jgi:hypothetical protein
VSSYVTWTLNSELEKLSTSHEELKDSHKKFREFILSDEFLKDYNKFEEKIGEFQEKIVTLVEAISMPSPEAAQAAQVTQPTQPLQTQLQLPQEVQQTHEDRYLWGKVIVAVLSLLVVGLAVHQGYVPAETMQWAAAGTILLLFLPKILSIIHAIIQRKGPKEEKAPSVKLEEWIHDRLRWIRERHFKAWTTIRGENPVTDMLEEYEILSVDPVVYDKKEYFKKRLAFEFLSTIGEIMAACNTNIWTRKSIVISAIVAAQTPFAKGS